MSDQEPAPAPGQPEDPAETSATGPDRTGQGGRKRPRRAVIIAVTVCAALVAAIIAVDSTSHPAKPAAKPVPAPNFTLPSLRDPAQQVSLSAYGGRPVVINFFASWCAPCKQETPLLARFSRTQHAVVIIGVDADDSASPARQFVAAEGITYPVAFETTEAVADAYGVSEVGIPETFFLDSRHRIVKRVIGDVTLKELTDDSAIIKSPVSKD